MFAPGGATAFSVGSFGELGRASSLQTRVLGGDVTAWYSSSATYSPTLPAATVRAVLGTNKNMVRPPQQRIGWRSDIY